jgi:hypothetical protein
MKKLRRANTEKRSLEFSSSSAMKQSSSSAMRSAKMLNASSAKMLSNNSTGTEDSNHQHQWSDLTSQRTSNYKNIEE